MFSLDLDGLEQFQQLQPVSLKPHLQASEFLSRVREMSLALNCNHLVDIGCGEGKLTLQLSGYVVGVDSDQWNILQAERSNTLENTHFVQAFLQTFDLDSMILKLQQQFDLNSDRWMVVCHKACGELSLNVSRAFQKSRLCVGMVNLGCCYHLCLTGLGGLQRHVLESEQDWTLDGIKSILSQPLLSGQDLQRKWNIALLKHLIDSLKLQVHLESNLLSGHASVFYSNTGFTALEQLPLMHPVKFINQALPHLGISEPISEGTILGHYQWYSGLYETFVKLYDYRLSKKQEWEYWMTQERLKICGGSIEQMDDGFCIIAYK
ncbi:hypothetical protein EDD86DRAFT_110686 [Gorgonomyces haynaldii]|nr:hypothetical protein EDD86DRAFT_110686 [Gorgonomyces haynaldii]